LKSVFLEYLVKSQNEENRTEDNGVKVIGAINFSDIIDYVKSGLSSDDFANLCEDIKSGKVKIGMDASSVDTLLANKDNNNVKALVQNAKLPKMDIDVNNLTELSSESFNQLRAMGVNIGKVYVNSGYDEAAARGYTPDIYSKIVTNAEAMIDKAKSEAEKKNPGKRFEDLSERDRFMAIYELVTKKAKYNYNAVTANGELQYTSRNLQDFFCKNGSAVCAGFADSLVQLGKLSGLEIEYVQGDSKSKNMQHSEYHAWVRVKIDGKWYNADPTWDAAKVNGKNGYCLKEDADFDGHTLDNGYKPTYRRSATGTLIDSRRDEYSYEGPVGKDSITEEQAKYLKSNYIPNAPSATIAGKSWFTVFLNFMIKITSMPRKVASKLKEKFKSNKLDAAKLASDDAEDYIKEEAEKEGAFDNIKVNQEQAESYVNNRTEKGEHASPENEREINGR